MNDENTDKTPGAEPQFSAGEIAAAIAANPSTPTIVQSMHDSVLLIDGDNDPHVPPDVHPTRFTLVRVFLRPGAQMPRTLEKKLSHLPHCATVVSPKGGANAADFVMSLHAGMLHATLPHHVPFLMVTNDATLAAMTAELQRLGRIATIWTSHPDATAMSAEAREDSADGAGGGAAAAEAPAEDAPPPRAAAEDAGAPPAPPLPPRRPPPPNPSPRRRPTCRARREARPSPKWPGPTRRDCSASRTSLRG